MENFDLTLEVSNLMTYESRDEKGLPHAERRTEKNDERGRRQNSIVAVGAEVVCRQQSFPLWWQAQGFTVGVAESNSDWNWFVKD